MYAFRNKASFYNAKLLAPRSNPKLEDHPSLAVRDCLFNIFTATLHIGGGSSFRNLGAWHALVTETHYHGISYYIEQEMLVLINGVNGRLSLMVLSDPLLFFFNL